MFHVSTIHSFFWTLMKPHQSDIKAWVKGRIEDKIADTRLRISNFGPRVQQRTRDNARTSLEGLQQDLAKISGVEEFRYGTGSDYEAGILGHDDIINIVPQLLAKYALLRQIVAGKYPYVFVDECQDTMPVVVDALKALAGTIEKWPCMGFFGDPMQRIFLSGAPAIAVPDTWKTITKPENFRCPTEVLKVINRIRLEDDGLQQTRGRHETIDGQSVPVVGAAHLFVVPADGQRRERIKAIRRWMSQKYQDPLWKSDDEDNVKMLVIVHRMAAMRLGFANLFNAFNDFGGSSLKDGFTEGTAWALTPLRSYLVPLVVAANEKRQFDVISLLRKNCPLLEHSELKPDAPVANYLDSLQKSLAKLQSYFADGSSCTVRDVLVLAQSEKMTELDQRILDHLKKGLPDEDSDNDTKIMHAFFTSPAIELLAYQTYIERLSPFATQQGIKGTEFERVLTVVDDEESTHFLFSYNKYFGITPLSAADYKNIDEGKETVVDRTRRLFYVCCSRAEKHLAVAIFVPDVNAAVAMIVSRGFFEITQVVQLADLEALEST
jgi:DNA helicase II / ATP-dependent DNA helicase PcrA